MKWVLFKEIYVERVELRHPGSDHPANIRRVLDRFTRYLGLVERDLSSITNLDFERYAQRRSRDTWRGNPLQPRTINNELQILNTAFAFAGPPAARGPGRRNLGLLQTVPYADYLPELDTEPVACTSAQLERFLEATQHATVPRYPGVDPQKFWTAVLIVGLVTSLRRKALLRIPRPDNYTLYELRQLVLPARLNKTRREQRIALGSERVVEIVGSMPSLVGEPLLPWRNIDGRQMGLSHFNRYMKQLQERAGISPAQQIKTKHLRSTAATEIAERFGDAVAKKKLGHSPKSNVINTSYKARRISEIDHAASEHLAAMVLPLMQPEDLQLSLFEESHAS